MRQILVRGTEIAISTAGYHAYVAPDMKTRRNQLFLFVLAIVLIGGAIAVARAGHTLVGEMQALEVALAIAIAGILIPRLFSWLEIE